MSVEKSLKEVRRRMAAAAARVGRNVEDVELVAIGKGQAVSVLRQAFDAGQRVFGENRGQELVSKVGDLPEEVRWHFVGSLQTNKVRLVRPWVDLIQSFDRDRLVKPWLKGLDNPPPALLQVNIGMEARKSGVPPDEVLETFERWECAGIRLRGIMAIPPFGVNPESSRPYFARMREIRDLLSGRVGRELDLSMGMTDDFEVAIEEGSTMVRVGRAIFGQRPTEG